MGGESCIDEKSDEEIMLMISSTRDESELVRVATELHGRRVNPSRARDRVKKWVSRRMSGRTQYQCTPGQPQFQRSGSVVTWFDRLGFDVLSKGRKDTPQGFIVTPEYLSHILQRTPDEIITLMSTRSGIRGFDL